MQHNGLNYQASILYNISQYNLIEISIKYAKQNPNWSGELPVKCCFKCVLFQIYKINMTYCFL